jgi:hypothetical protein
MAIILQSYRRALMRPLFFIMFFISTVGGKLAFTQTDSLNIYWDKNSEPDISQYQLYRATDSLGQFQLFRTVNHPVTHVVDRDQIKPGGLYIYKLTAVNEQGLHSSFSNAVIAGIPQVIGEAEKIASGRENTFPVSNWVHDPDNKVSQLQITFRNQQNVACKVSGNQLILEPVPIDFSGEAGFTINVEDPNGFWDQKNVELTVAPSADDIVPDDFHLFQNYPNPFNPTTIIRYALPQDSQVKIVVYNHLGQKIKTLVSGYQTAGIHRIRWDGTNTSGATVSSGSYYYVLSSDHFHETQKMLFVK